MGKFPKIKHKLRIKLNSLQIIALGFLGVILTGALLLMLPISSKSRQVTPFVDAVFSATTSVCVTGLVVRDTGTYWSTFGQFIILMLIQIGGLGVITVACAFMLMAGKKIGLHQRSTLQEAVAAPKLSGIVKLTGFILKGTFIIELVGALLLSPVFIKDFGWAKGLWMSLFHSVSAFCNAGIDIMGVVEPYSSFTSYSANYLINIVLMLLIIIGGLGFLTWDDLRTNKFRFKKYRLQTKVILLTTLLLIFVPATIFFFVEYKDLPLGERILASLFQAVTPRTAGMNTTDLTQFTDSGKVITIILMMIGGAPGSTAGGMKITTLAVLVACMIAVIRRRSDAQLIDRRVGHDVVFTSVAIFLIYLVSTVFGAIIISLYEGLPFLTCLYETVSAMATVGLTLGITPELGTLSKIVLIILMYIGRIGGLTLIVATVPSRPIQEGKLPIEKITVG